MKKRGFLLAEEVLKVILAVIALSFLAYLLFSLYNANKASKDLELAEESLSHLVQELSVERAEIQIYNPKGWVISSWPLAGEMPLSCSNLGWAGCICICDDSFLPFKSGLEDCDSAGACLENLQNFNLDENVKIKDPPVILTINYENKRISKK